MITANDLYDAVGISWKAISMAADILLRARVNGNMVYTMGNGGSHSNAEHFANDLTAHGVRAMCLGCNPATLTAIANDFDYEMVYVRQLETLEKTGDVLIAISTSGNSYNIIRAVFQFKGPVIGMTGTPGGGLVDMVTVPLIAATNEVDLSENIHTIMMHFIIRELINGPQYLNS